MMARAMNRSTVVALIAVLLVLVSAAEAAPKKPKKVKCKDKNFPACYKSKVDLYCPDACLRTCTVDCASCQPVCPLPPPPPPPSPPPPPPRRPRRSPPPPPPVPTTVTPPPPSPTVPTPTVDSPPPPSATPSIPGNQSPPPPVVVLSPPANSPPTTPTSNPPPPPATTPSLPPPVFTPPPPSTEVESMMRTRCRNRNYPNCFGKEQTCPSECPTQCEINCVTCKPICDCNVPGAVCQDPRFIGGDGIMFYFHGKKDRDFCLVSDSNLHINGHFIGKRNEKMTRDFTWVQSIGVLFDTHQLSIAAKRTSTWDNAIDRFSLSFDGEPIHLPHGQGAKWISTSSSSGITMSRSRDTNALIVKAEGNFKIKATIVPVTLRESRVHKYGITDKDCFAHLDLSFTFYSLTGNVTGVLGQTYANNYVSRVKVGVAMPVLGGDKEFSTSSLFSTDCMVSRFQGRDLEDVIPRNSNFSNMNCGTGINGGAVVCKR